MAGADRTATGKLTTAATGHADHVGHDDDGPGGSTMAYPTNSARTTATAASATPLPPIPPSRRAHFMAESYRLIRSFGICPRSDIRIRPGSYHRLVHADQEATRAGRAPTAPAGLPATRARPHLELLIPIQIG